MIVDSSIWDEPDYVFRVWIAMLALKDMDHVVRLTAYQLASRMKWREGGEAKVLDAWKILSAPDTKRVEPQEFEGRRIKAVEEGWFMLNGDKYRDMVQLEMKRARNRKAQETFRQKTKLEAALKAGTVTPESLTPEQQEIYNRKKSGRKKGGNAATTTPLPGEAAYVKNYESGYVDENGVPTKSQPTPQEIQDAQTFRRIHMEDNET